MSTESKAPTGSEEFDRAYRLPITIWGDVRIPDELKELANLTKPTSAIELGCGIGRFTRFMAKQGIAATGVDFSTVAIARAQKKVSHDTLKASFVVGDVTALKAVSGPFDVSFDIGCFHCLDENSKRQYVSEVFRILKPRGIHLVWAMDTEPPPNRARLNPDVVSRIFSNGFKLQKEKPSRRRLIRSHWYWFVRL